MYFEKAGFHSCQIQSDKHEPNRTDAHIAVSEEIA